MKKIFYLKYICLLLIIFLISFSAVHADDDFSFDIEEFEKKTLDWGGYIELKWDHMKINEGSAFSLLNLYEEDPVSTIDRFTGSLLFDGSYTKDMVSAYWAVKAIGMEDNFGWEDHLDIYEGYVSLSPTPIFTANIGKKSYKWGKGYAWNPAGFINRPKDPNNPEEALEGYVIAEADMIKSFTGLLQTVSLTTVAIPVREDLNDDFGKNIGNNYTGKLYLLIADIDIDFIYFNGDSKPTRYGLDFSTNVTVNFEIHGEFAYTQNAEKVILNTDDSIGVDERDTSSYLLGIRYLSENNITSIIEYYHNGDGYSSSEFKTFYDFIRDADSEEVLTIRDNLINKSKKLAMTGYGKPQFGKNYIYARFTQKEPFDFLYFTPGFTTIINLDDKSYSLTPEAVYTGFTNWEFKTKFSVFVGAADSEYGEKMNSNKLEARVRYFF